MFFLITSCQRKFLRKKNDFTVIKDKGFTSGDKCTLVMLHKKTTKNICLKSLLLTGQTNRKQNAVVYAAPLCSVVSEAQEGRLDGVYRFLLSY